MEYLIKLLIAFFLVLALPYYLSKLIIAWRRNSNDHGKSPNLSLLVQQKIQHFGGTFRPSPYRPSTKAQTLPQGNRVVQVYQRKIKALQETQGHESEWQDLEHSVRLFEAALKKKTSHFKNISDELNSMAKASLLPREIVNITISCLEERVFILSEEQREVMNYHAIKNLIMARTLLHAFVQDALMQSSTVCKLIERSKNKSPDQVYLAIRLLILLKQGAAQKGLYEMALHRPWAIHEKFKQLKDYQINNAILSILRKNKGCYCHTDQIGKIIYGQIQQFEQFKKNYIDQKSREQEEKRAHSGKKGSSPNPNPNPLQEYYQILGCRDGDSTATIKKCYRKLALKNHPDRVSTQSEKSQEQAHEGFVKIQLAYGEIMRVKKTKKKAS